MDTNEIKITEEEARIIKKQNRKAIKKGAGGTIFNILSTVFGIALYMIKMFLIILRPLVYLVMIITLLFLFINTLWLLPCLHPVDFTYGESIILEVILIAVLAICVWAIDDEK